MVCKIRLHLVEKLLRYDTKHYMLLSKNVWHFFSFLPKHLKLLSSEDREKLCWLRFSIKHSLLLMFTLIVEISYLWKNFKKILGILLKCLKDLKNITPWSLPDFPQLWSLIVCLILNMSSICTFSVLFYFWEIYWGWDNWKQ